MRGADYQQSGMFSYISAERRVPEDHPLRAIRTMVDVALRNMGAQFEAMYAQVGRPSIAPEKLLRALLLQVLYTVRSERMLMEQLNYNLLFRWFVGMNIDDPVWDVTVFTKNRERLLAGGVASALFAEVLAQARSRALLSSEHFTVDGTLIEAWAGHKSFKRKDGTDQQPPNDPGNPTVDFHGERRRNATHQSTTDPEARLAKKGAGKEAKLSFAGHVLMENRNGIAVNGCVTLGRGTRGGRGCGGNGGGTSGPAPRYGGRRQSVRHQGVCSRDARPPGDSACRAQGNHYYRCAHYSSSRLCD